MELVQIIQVSKGEYLAIAAAGFYRLYALPVIYPAALKKAEGRLDCPFLNSHFKRIR